MTATRSQAGVALITALIVVAIATVLAADAAFRQQIEIRRSSALMERDQARLYADALEVWAGVLMKGDADDNDIDHLGEPWASEVAFLPIEEGSITASLEDLQGRFNLNNLVVGQSVDALSLARFERLLQALELPRDLADAIVDWIDPDVNPTGAVGAEDDYYSRLTPPYRAANRAIADVSELLMIRGMTYENYQRLAPFVTALPERTDINVNTAKPEVLLSISPALSSVDAETIGDRQKDDGYDSVNGFLTEFATLQPPIAPEGLGVSTGYLQLRAVILFADARVDLTSLLRRDPDTGVAVSHRSYARPLTPAPSSTVTVDEP